MGAYSACKALVIGVGSYADPQYDLSYARSDAEAIAELLENEFGFDQVWTLYDNDATKQNIRRFFERNLQQVDEDDGLLIFFAGHGITVTSAIGDERGFLVPHDGDAGRVSAYKPLLAAALAVLPLLFFVFALLILALSDWVTGSGSPPRWLWLAVYVGFVYSIAQCFLEFVSPILLELKEAIRRVRALER